MAKNKPITTHLTALSVGLAGVAAEALVTAEHLSIKKKFVEDFSLDLPERAIAAELLGISVTLKRKLKKKDASFTVAETASIITALAESVLDGEPLHQRKLLIIAKKLIECLQSNVVTAASANEEDEERPD